MTPERDGVPEGQKSSERRQAGNQIGFGLSLDTLNRYTGVLGAQKHQGRQHHQPGRFVSVCTHSPQLSLSLHFPPQHQVTLAALPRRRRPAALFGHLLGLQQRRQLPPPARRHDQPNKQGEQV